MVTQNSAAAGQPPTVIGLAALATMAYRHHDLTALWQQLVARVQADPRDAGALFDLSILRQIGGDRAGGLVLQQQALAIHPLYRRLPTIAAERPLRLLALMAPGDFMANTPVDFLLAGSDVSLDMLYLVPGSPLPERVPNHDVAFVAVGESDENLPLLRGLEGLVQAWPRPVLNAPEQIVRLSRHGVWTMLKSVPGIAMPACARLDRAALADIGLGRMAVGAVLEDGRCPILVRPSGSHAGHGLSKLDDPAAISGYLQAQPEPEFYLSQFIDYRGGDGRFRKYRVAMIGGRPFASHMAISDHWMVHYLNAGMSESAEKRAEEAEFMAGFDAGFARRHAAAFRSLDERVGLAYYAIDCGETVDGRLLMFEVDTAMIVHSMDPPDLFPYKQPAMRKLFAGFREMLHAAVRPPASAKGG